MKPQERENKSPTPAGARRLVATLIVGAAMVLVLSARGSTQAPAAAPEASAPSLLVLIVVDQMRADYVDRFSSDWTGGLNRLITQGAWFKNAAYPYLQTMTCAGHATLATGLFPHTHGIIQNEWPRGNPQQEPLCTDDPMVPDLGYLKPATGGHSARQLVEPTLADVLRTTRKAKVVSLSLKPEAAIMLAGHGGDAIVWFNDRLDALATSSGFTARPVAAVAAFAQANPVEAYFRRTWDRVLPLNKYRDVDNGAGEVVPRGWSPSFPHPLNGSGGRTPDVDFRIQWYRSPFVDDYLGRMAGALAESMQLGKTPNTDVLAVSFSSTDEVGHLFGPQSQEIQDTLARLDQTLAALFEKLDALVGRNRYVVALSADHGVTPIPERARREGKDAGRVDPAEIADAIETQLFGAWGRGRYVAALAGTNMNVYFYPGVYERLRMAPALADGVIRRLQVFPGVSRVFRAEQIRDQSAITSTDPVLRAAALSYYPGRSGDLVIVLKPGWNGAGNPAMHGSPWPDDQRVPILFMGPSIKPGQYTQAVTPADIAPTLAALAGITLPKTEGRVLREALK